MHISLHDRLNTLKNKFPYAITLIESVIEKLNDIGLTEHEMHGLRNLPEQFVKSFELNGYKTTKLHEWAKQLIQEVLEVDNLLLSAKDSNGNNVLYTYLESCIGKYDSIIHYEKIERVFNRNNDYVDKHMVSGELQETPKNLLTDKNILGESAYSMIHSFAYMIHDDSDELPSVDLKLLNILKQKR